MLQILYSEKMFTLKQVNKLNNGRREKHSIWKCHCRVKQLLRPALISDIKIQSIK